MPAGVIQKAFETLWKTIAHYNQFVNQFMRVSQDTADPGLAYVNWGIDLAEAGKLDEAVKKFEQAAAIAPDRAEPFNNWGVALAKLGRIDEAVVLFEKAHAIDPLSVKALTMWGAALLEKGDIDGAEAKYKQALSASPGNPEPYVNWGIGLARLGRFADAIKHFQMALAIYPYQGEVYFFWGAALAEMHRYEDAITKFREAVRYLPTHAESYYFWGIALNRLKAYEPAIEKNLQALALDPQNPEIYLNIGDAYGNLGQYDQAIENYRQAIALNASIPEAYLSLGIALGRQHHYEEAYASLGRALELDPLYTKVYYHWGALLNQQRRFTEACMYLKHYYEAYPNDIDNLINYGLALTHTGNKQDGMKILKEALSHESDNPQIHFLIGTQYLLHDQLDQAEHHLNIALENNHEFLDAAINLSLALSEKNQHDAALRILRPFVRQYADSPQVQFFYGTLQYRSGDTQEAINRFQKAIDLEPQHVDAHLGLLEVFAMTEQLDDALRIADTLHGLSPDFIPALHLDAQVSLQHVLKHREHADKVKHFLERAKVNYQKIQSHGFHDADVATALSLIDTVMIPDDAVRREKISNLKTQNLPAVLQTLIETFTS